MFSVRDSGSLVCWLLLSGLLSAAGCSQSAELAVVDATKQDTNNASASISNTMDHTTDGSETAGHEAEAACCRKDAAPADVQPVLSGVVVPDVMLVNQDGEPVQFKSDLVGGKIVAINFIFTTCKGICPPMSANFAQLQKLLGHRYGEDVALISVSVDPTVDTPERLHAWRDTFGGGPGWTLLTGTKQDVDSVLKEMEVFTADKNDHSPFILLGDAAAGKWTRIHGLTAPERLADIIASMYEAAHADQQPTEDPSKAAAEVDSVSKKAPAEPAELTAPHKYFTDVELVNQKGETMRLYSDVLKGKVVVINSFFSTCKGSCPVMMSSFARIQEQFNDRLGKDLCLVSITVDPSTDTPQVMSAYAEQWKARPGWLFLSGEKANVEAALYKLGHYVENKESHSNIFIIGNEATGLWKKAKGLSNTEELFPLIEEVLNDRKL